MTQSRYFYAFGAAGGMAVEHAMWWWNRSGRQRAKVIRTKRRSRSVISESVISGHGTESLPVLQRMGGTFARLTVLQFRPTAVPIDPALLPVWTGKLLSRLSDRFLHSSKVPRKALRVVPIEKRFQKRQLVIREVGVKLHGAVEVFARFFLAANAGRPARRIAIKITQRSVRAGIVHLGVQLERLFEFIFHLPHEMKCAKRLGPGQLPQVHPQPIMRSRTFWIPLNSLPRGVHTMIGNLRALGILTGQLCPIKRRR